MDGLRRVLSFLTVMSLIASLMVVALPPSAAQAQEAPELDVLCANRWNGDVRYSESGSCSGNEITLELPDAFPFTLCANRWNQELRYSQSGSCSGSETTIEMPEAGILDVCVNSWNGSLRLMTSSCGSSSYPAEIVGQVAPVAVADGPYLTTVGEALAIPAPGLLDNDELGYPEAQIVSFGGGSLSGDATSIAAGIPVITTEASIQINADGSFTFFPSGTQASGTFTVQYRLQNAAGFSDATLTIEYGTAPAAQPDTLTGMVNTPISSTAPGLLANDSVGAPAGAITFFGGGSVSADITNAAGSTVAFGSGGSLTVNADGSYELTSPEGFTGEITFSYILANDFGESTALVTTTISAAPVAVADDGLTAPLYATWIYISGTLTNNDNLGSPEATITHFGAIDGSGIVTDNAAGSLAPFAGGSLQVHANGSLTVSGPTEPGVHTFQYRLTNSVGTSDATVTITVQQPPLAVDDGPAANSQIGDPFHIGIGESLTSSAAENLLVNDTPGVPTAVITMFGASTPDTTAGSAGQSAEGGTLTVNADGSFSYTPPTGFAGSDTFVYQISNGVGTSSTATVTILIGTPPVANADTYTPVVVGNVGISTTLSSNFSLLSNDQGSDLTFTDLTLTSTNGGSVTLNTDGTFTYTPPVGFSGSDSFTYEVTNAFNTPVSASVTLQVSEPVWFVSEAAADGGNGTAGAPFNCLVGAESDCFIQSGHNANDIIYVASGNYTGGLTLQNNQRLIGAGATDDFETASGLTFPADSVIEPPATGQAAPVITADATAGNNLTLASAVQVHGVNIQGSANGIAGQQISGATLNTIAISLSGTGVGLGMTDAGTVTLSGTNSISTTSGPVISASGTTLTGTIDSLTSSSASPVGIGIVNGPESDLTIGQMTITAMVGVGFSAGLLLFNAGNFTVSNSESMIQASDGHGIAINTTTINATFASMSSTNSVSGGIVLQGAAGSLTINGGEISEPEALAIAIEASEIDFSYAGDVISTNPTLGTTVIGIGNNTAGSTTLTGQLTISTIGMSGIFVANNSNHIVTINNPLSTIRADGGEAIHVQDTVLGDAGIIVKSVTSNGGVQPGIAMLNTLGNGGLTVLGEGTPGSGGTISNKTTDSGSESGIGVYLYQTHDITLNDMSIQENALRAIDGYIVADFSLLNSHIDGGEAGNTDHHNISFVGLTGIAQIRDSTITNAFMRNIAIGNATGTLDLTLEGNTIGGTNMTAGGDSFIFQGLGDASLTLTATGNTFTGAFESLLHVNLTGQNTADLTIQDNAFTGVDGSIGNGVWISNQAIDGTTPNVNLDVTYNISGTTSGSQTFNNIETIPIRIDSILETVSGTMDGTIVNNTIGQSGDPGSGSGGASGISLQANGSVVHQVEIANNTIYSVGSFSGIAVASDGPSSIMRADITNNQVPELPETGSSQPFSALYLFTGGSPGEASQMCAHVVNNTFADSSALGFYSVVVDQNSNAASYNFPGYTGPATGGAALNTFLESQNTIQGDVYSAFAMNVSGQGTSCVQ